MKTIGWLLLLYLITSVFNYLIVRTDITQVVWLKDIIEQINNRYEYDHDGTSDAGIIERLSYFFEIGASGVYYHGSHSPLLVVDTLTQYETLRWGVEMREWPPNRWESSSTWAFIEDLFMLDWDSSREIGTIWPWEEIGDNLISYAEEGRHLPVKLINRCPICHRHLHEVRYCSPDWTWRSLCGREGELIYCPHCKIQWRFHCEAMN